MDWSKTFKPERKATWDEIADAIHYAVTMSEVVARYTPSVRPRYNRIPCPLHNGKDYNFSFTRNGYKCFVCGATGDVITFVKETQGCATRVDAMRKINEDFNLHLPIDGECQINFREKIDERRAEREKLDAEQEAWEKEYANLTYCFAFYDTILMRPEEHPVSVISQAKERMAWLKWELEHMPPRPR